MNATTNTTVQAAAPKILPADYHKVLPSDYYKKSCTCGFAPAPLHIGHTQDCVDTHLGLRK